MERLVKKSIFPWSYFDESAETVGWNKLPGFICRKEFQYGMVFIFYPEAGYALPAIDIKCPHRDTIASGYPREEIGEWLGEIIILYDEFAFFVKIVFRFFIGYLYHIEDILPNLAILSIELLEIAEKI